MTSELSQKIREVQQTLPKSIVRDQSLTILVDYILRSRPLCRPFQEQPLSPACQEIYQAVHQQLFCILSSDIDRYNFPNQSPREWSIQRMQEAFAAILTDPRLKQLALEAKQYEPRTQQRQHLLTELIKGIQLSRRLIRPYRGELTRDFYQLIYEDAVNRTLLYVFQKIDLYDPGRGEGKFMNWVNFRLDKILKEIRASYQVVQETPICSKEIDALGTSEASPTTLEIIMQYIECDPDEIFKQERIKQHNKASFQDIFLAKRIQGKSWKEISQDWGIPMTTLSSFYWRCIKRFAPKIRQHVQDCT
ncbi:MAG: sigma-70 family RNA polymerase sigma factor [Symploca sp. SIO2E6]|nr:sigma-70 family RNA polymerase sigma factor [Symploca sp. SIO2E6]